MPRTLAALVLAALVAGGAAAQPPIPPAREVPMPVGAAPDVPAEIKVKVGRPATITVPAEDTGFKATFPQDKCRFVRLYSDDPKLMVLEAWPFEAGTYVVVFWKKGETVGSMTSIIAGDPPPPTPPTPPVNPHRAALKAAFDTDAGDAAAKNDVRAKLVELYALAATMAADPAVQTTDVLRERLRRAGATLAADQLVGTRTAIANLLAPVLPLGQPLTPESRSAAAALFRLISDALAW